MLDEQQVSEILTERLVGMTIDDLTARYGVGRNAMFSIVKGHPHLHMRAYQIGEYIYQFYTDHMVPPTTREIAANAVEGITLSTSVVDHHLKTLNEHGLIKLSDEVKARKITIPDTKVIVPDFGEQVKKLLVRSENSSPDKA